MASTPGGGEQTQLAAPLWERFERNEGLEKCEGVFMAPIKGFGRDAGAKRETRPGGLEDTECKKEVMGLLFQISVQWAGETAASVLLLPSQMQALESLAKLSMGSNAVASWRLHTFLFSHSVGLNKGQ